MNTYIHLWENEIDDITLDTAVKKTGEVLKVGTTGPRRNHGQNAFPFQLLSVLNEIIDDPVGEDEWRIQNWREVLDNPKLFHLITLSRFLRYASPSESTNSSTWTA